MVTTNNVMGVARPRVDLAVVRQHTPVQISIDSDAELVCVQVIGDHSVVLLGLTLSGAEMLMQQVSGGVTELLAVRQAIGDATEPEGFSGVSVR